MVKWQAYYIFLLYFSVTKITKSLQAYLRHKNLKKILLFFSLPYLLSIFKNPQQRKIDFFKKKNNSNLNFK